ncbi:MAG: hypothetical protein ACRDP6_48885 [Actinoallomurus sp.]
MSTDLGEDPVARPALDQLLDLAGATRPDIDRIDLHSAIIAARTVGWTWRRILKVVAQILADGETPYDLRNATLAPWQGGPRAHT